MARAYAARLGCIAMVFGLTQHFFGSPHLSQTIIHSIILLVVFSGLGYGIGNMTEELIRQSVEFNFRRKIEKSTGGNQSTPANPR